MKRLLAFLSIILLCLVFFGCSQEIETSDYVIVIPNEADISTKYASEILSKLIEEKTGVGISVVTDATPEQDKEILIGETNRDESKTSSSLERGQYLVVAKNDKIVIKGNGIYVGAGCSDFINKYAIVDTVSAKIDISELPKKETVFNYKSADFYDSVILMIGDGMGENHIKMAEQNGLSSFVARDFPSTGTSITHSQSVIDNTAKSTDSAASATAMATGYKTLNGYIGLDKNGNPVQNIRELAFELHAKTAVITTDVITGATPSAFMCHNVSRMSTEELQAGIDALISESKIDYVAGNVAENLTQNTKNALEKISSDGSNFFIMIEEGMIDKASHEKDEETAVEYVKRFNDSIAYATQFALCHPSTALIVTADHETGRLTPEKSAPCGYFFLSFDHTNSDVPIFALGAGTELFNGQRVENIEIARFCAKAYTSEQFGQLSVIE